MYADFFNEFLMSDDTLRVYEDDRLVFCSVKGRLLPLLEYISQFAQNHRQVVILDKTMGNAAALLSLKADCREVYSPLGSRLAVKTLDSHGVRHHLTKLVPYIQKSDGGDMCPMEKLSMGKGPEEFYKVMTDIIDRSGTESLDGKKGS